MIVDSHCHIFPESFAERRSELAQKDATFQALFSNPKARLAGVSDLLSAMDRDGVDCSLVMGMGWTGEEVAREVNDYLIQSCRQHPDRLVAFCSVNPRWGTRAISEIRRCVGEGLRGVGELHADSQEFDIADQAQMAPVMDTCREQDIPILVHASEPVGHSYPGKGDTTPQKLLQLIQNFPENRIICAHWGGGLPFYALMPEVEEALKNVFFDTAVSPFLYQPGIFDAVPKIVGAEKILLGSDYPLVSHRRLAEQLESSGLSLSEKAAIQGGNAVRLFNL